MPHLKNWDNGTWLSSKEYIESFIKFLIKNKKINKDSHILDIGCGRGKILGKIKTKLKLKNKPIGVDLVNHKNKDRNFIFKKTDAFRFLKTNKKKFDLIIIKQTIHFFPLNKILKLTKCCHNTLSENGKLMIFSINEKQSQIPTFNKMQNKLQISYKKDSKIRKKISTNFKNIKDNVFNFKVKIKQRLYLDMIRKRYISILLEFNEKELIKGVQEIKNRYPNIINFKDSLICLMISKSN